MVEIRTLLITKNDGSELQIDIPVTYKVTFGPAFVGGSEKITGRIPMALRIYETDKMQLAIFTDVSSFRDMAIPIRQKKVNTQTKDGFVECEGVRKRTTFQATTFDWVNPDESDKPKLIERPTDIEIFGKEEE